MCAGPMRRLEDLHRAATNFVLAPASGVDFKTDANRRSRAFFGYLHFCRFGGLTYRRIYR